MRRKILISILISLVLITACSTKSEKKTSQIEKENMIIVDVRTKEEYQNSHIVGAINIPYDTIDDNTNLAKDKIIAVYCKSGKRSSIAYKKLKALGYKVKDLGAYDTINLEKE